MPCAHCRCITLLVLTPSLCHLPSVLPARSLASLSKFRSLIHMVCSRHIILNVPLVFLAQSSLTEVNTRILKVCVQTILSNGRSIYQVAVEWATGTFALLALLSAVFYLFTPNTLALLRLFDLLCLYQWTAPTALQTLNYSSVWRALTSKFAWAMGLFSSFATSIQTSINYASPHRRQHVRCHWRLCSRSREPQT